MRRPSRAWLIVLAAALAGLVIDSVLVFSVRSSWDGGLVVDAGHLRTAWLDWVMVRVADLGAWFVVGPLTVAVVAALVLARRPWAAALVGAAVTGAEILQIALKAVFERPRPELTTHLEKIGSASYPSGHAAVSCAFALAVCLVLWPAASSRERGIIATAAAIYVAAIGFARVFLGVHYPSDVIAGWLVAVAWVTFVALAVSALRARSAPPLPDQAVH